MIICVEKLTYFIMTYKYQQIPLNISYIGFTQNDTFVIPEPTLGQPPSSPRAGSQITRQTWLGASG